MEDRIDEQVDQSLGEDNKAIAQNLLMQAALLEQEAEKKRADAIKYDPSLTEKAMQPAKRGRGRPRVQPKRLWLKGQRYQTTKLEQAVASLDTSGT